jgi:RNA polymerase sigma-70 factor, ECF subfamily
MDSTDEELMARIATGDEAAFRQLARRHLPRALALARRFTANEADAEEVAQEAILRVWLTAPRWRPVAAFRTWLYRVVVNLCLNRRRRAPFVALEDVAEPPDAGPDAIAQIEAAEDSRRVAAAIAALPDRQRIAIVLTYHEGVGNAEAAAILGTSISGLESLLVRAKHSLRVALRPPPPIDRRDRR